MCDTSRMLERDRVSVYGLNHVLFECVCACVCVSVCRQRVKELNIKTEKEKMQTA